MSKNTDQVKKFVAIIRIDTAASFPNRKMQIDKNRVVDVCKRVVEQINVLSTRKTQLMFTDSDGITFGFFLTSDKPAGYIRASLTGDTATGHDSILLNGDSVVVMELGEEFSGFGDALHYSWLQLS